VERRRADADPQPGRGAVRQPGRHRRLRGRLRGRHRGLRPQQLFWCAGCQGGIYPLDGHVPYHMGGVRTAALLSPAPDRQDAPRTARLGLARHAGALRPVLRAGHGQDRLQDPAHLPDPQHRQGSAAAAASPSAAPRAGAPARSTRSAARTSPSCSSARGTAVWATEAGPHEEGVAAGQAANPVARGNVTTPGATAVVPGYTTTPPERSYYRQPNLSSQGSARLSACALTPTDPLCQAQRGAFSSANTPRPTIGADDPAVAAARASAARRRPSWAAWPPTTAVAPPRSPRCPPACSHAVACATSASATTAAAEA
jgi:hypothetical protein